MSVGWWFFWFYDPMLSYILTLTFHIFLIHFLFHFSINWRITHKMKQIKSHGFQNIKLSFFFNFSNMYFCIYICTTVIVHWYKHYWWGEIFLLFLRSCLGNYMKLCPKKWKCEMHKISRSIFICFFFLLE